MKKIFWTIIILIISYIFAGIIFQYTKNADNLLQEIKVSPEEIEIGDAFTVSGKIKTTWLQNPKITLNLPDNVMLYGEIKKKLQSFNFSSAVYDFSASIIYIDEEKLAKSPEIVVNFKGLTNPKSKIIKYFFTCPKIKLSSKDDLKLELVDEIKIKSENCIKCYMIYAIILTIIIIIIFIVLRKRKSKTAIKEKPWITAKNELEELKKNINKYEPVMFFVHISDILKHYISNAYNIPISEMTTQEFFTLIQRDKFVRNELLENLKSIFTLGDLIKFAKQESELSQEMQVISLSENFINITSSELIEKEKQEKENV